MNDFLLSLIVLTFTLVGSLAALYFKKSSNAKSILTIMQNKELYFGIVLYMIASVLNIVALFHWDYSKVLPLTGLTYVWTLLFAKILIKEHINLKKLIGVMFIIIGIILIII
jgi:uncharacterized membrane protein